MLKTFNDFINEGEEKEMSPVLRKSLDKLDSRLKTIDDVILAITSAGLEQVKLTSRAQTADYSFRIPDDEAGGEYRTYSTGYIKYIGKYQDWRRGNMSGNTMSPITRERIFDAKDRLLLVLRRAIKLNLEGKIGTKQFKEWIESDMDIKDWAHKHRGSMAAKNFGFR